MKILKYADDLPEKSDLTFIATLARSLRPELSSALGGHEEDLINMVKVLTQANYTPKAPGDALWRDQSRFCGRPWARTRKMFIGSSVWTETDEPQRRRPLE